MYVHVCMYMPIIMSISKNTRSIGQHALLEPAKPSLHACMPACLPACLPVPSYSSPPSFSSGTNAEVEYSITPASPYFTIDNTTGVVSTATELDRESITTHSLIIMVNKRGRN